MKHGDALTVISAHKELTPQQAADLLNVALPYLIRLLDEGGIPCTRTSIDVRWLCIDDVIAYKQRRDNDRSDALDELTRLSQELVGYDELKK